MSQNKQNQPNTNSSDANPNGIPLNFNASRRVSVQTEDQWQNIPNRNMLGCTPGGNHLYGVTPGGTRIIYDRYYILSARERGTKHTPDVELPIIEGVTCGNYDNNLMENKLEEADEDEEEENEANKENLNLGIDQNTHNNNFNGLMNGNRRISDEALMPRIDESNGHQDNELEEEEEEDMEF